MNVLLVHLRFQSRNAGRQIGAEFFQTVQAGIMFVVLHALATQLRVLFHILYVYGIQSKIVLGILRHLDSELEFLFIVPCLLLVQARIVFLVLELEFAETFLDRKSVV